MNSDNNNMRKKRLPGRPKLPTGEKKVAISVKLPPSLIRLMDLLPESRGVIIEKSVRERYGDK